MSVFGRFKRALGQAMDTRSSDDIRRETEASDLHAQRRRETYGIGFIPKMNETDPEKIRKKRAQVSSGPIRFDVADESGEPEPAGSDEPAKKRKPMQFMRERLSRTPIRRAFSDD